MNPKSLPRGSWRTSYERWRLDRSWSVLLGGPDGPDAGHGATIDELTDDIDRVLDEHRSEP